MKILFLVSGSVATYKACEVVSTLTQRGHEVQVVMTDSAKQFVGQATFEALSGRPAHSEVFATGQMMAHIDLARWADVFVLCPASASRINSVANGAGSDLVGTLFLARRQEIPVHIFPAMNPEMWLNPATQSSVGTLRSWGMQIHEPAQGRTACGEVGSGRLLNPEEIIAILLSPRKGAKKILITYGGTEVPIDSVRSITNSSTGKTGSTLARAFADQGHLVTVLRSRRSMAPTSSLIKDHQYLTFDEFKYGLEELLKENRFDVVVQAAAVSDFSVAGDKTQKMRTADTTLQLVRNPKLINSIRSLAPSTQLVGFKLLSSANESEKLASAEKLFQEADCDLVVCNDTARISKESHSFEVFGSRGGHLHCLAAPGSAAELADLLLSELSERNQKEVRV